MEIPRGPKFLRESMGLNWNFQRDGGFKPKNLPWEGYGYFRNYTYSVLLKQQFESTHILTGESHTQAAVFLLATAKIFLVILKNLIATLTTVEVVFQLHCLVFFYTARAIFLTIARASATEITLTARRK